MSKRNIILVITSISIVLLITVLITQRRKATDSLTTSTKYVPKPEIPQRLSSKGEVLLGLDESDFNFPKILPIINISPRSIQQSELEIIAKAYDFFDEPLIAKDVDQGDIYIWRNDTKNLRIIPETGKIDYFSDGPLNTEDKGLDETEITKISSEFLNKNSLIDLDTLDIHSVKYYSLSPFTQGYIESTKNNYIIQEVVYKFKSINYELFKSNTLKPLISVTLLKDGSVREMEINLIDNVQKTQQQYELLTYPELEINLDKAIVLNIENAQASLTDFTIGDVKNITIDKVKIAYMYDDSSSNIAQPVYIFEGDANISSFQNVNTRAILILPAIKQ